MSRLIELEGEMSEVASELGEWNSLVNNSGWGRLMAISEGQVNERARHILKSPLSKMDEALPQEFEKGEASGIELFRGIPEVEIEKLQSRMKQLEQEIANEQTSEKAAGDAGGSASSGGGSRVSLDAASDAFGTGSE